MAPVKTSARPSFVARPKARATATAMTTKKATYTGTTLTTCPTEAPIFESWEATTTSRVSRSAYASQTSRRGLLPKRP